MESVFIELSQEDFKPFSAVCKTRGSTPKLELKKFMARYCAKYGRDIPGMTVDVEVELPADMAHMADEEGVDLGGVLTDTLVELLDQDG